GIAQGVAQNFGSNLLGSFAAPVLLVAFAEAFGWRGAFYLAGIPGIVTSILMWFLIKEPAVPRASETRAEDRMSIGAALRERNILICVLLSIFLVSYLVTCWAFMPLFLTQMRGFTPTQAGWLMGTLGISATI